MYETQKIGHFWTHILGYEERQTCQTCNMTELMSHIIVHCRATPVQTIWKLAKEHWPQDSALLLSHVSCWTCKYVHTTQSIC